MTELARIVEVPFIYLLFPWFGNLIFNIIFRAFGRKANGFLATGHLVDASQTGYGIFPQSTSFIWVLTRVYGSIYE